MRAADKKRSEEKLYIARGICILTASLKPLRGLPFGLKSLRQ